MIDITHLWNSAHPHLAPLPSALPLPPSQTETCGSCESVGAFRVVAQVRFGQDHWRENVQVAHCRHCGKWYLPDDQLAATGTGCVENGEPTAVNARLWSNSPTFLNLEPTTRCNYRCWYCVGRSMEQKDIDIEDFAAVLDHFPTVKTIALVGEGEPLMHKGFFEMAQMAADRGIRVVSLSNGSTFSTENVKKICAAGIAYISVSIDSSEAATFASSRLGGDLQQVLKGIKRLTDYRDAHGFRYPRIGLKGTLFAETINQIPQIVALAAAHGVEIFESFQPLNPMSGYVPIYPAEKRQSLATGEQLRVIEAIGRDSEQATRRLKSVQQFCEEEGIALSKNGHGNGLRPNCDEEWIYALLSGDITPCCQIKTPPSPNWNLVHHSLDQVLRDAVYENTRFNLWNGLFPSYCKGCHKTGDHSAELPITAPAPPAVEPNAPLWIPGWAGPDDEADLLALFHDAFGQDMDPALWRWKYAGRKRYGALVRKHGAVVAFYGGLPRQISLFGQPSTAVQVCDVMVAPSERGVLTRHGPFYLAAEFFQDHVGLKKTYPLAFGFPSRRHCRLGEKLGFYAKVGAIVHIDWPVLEASPHLLLGTRPLGQNQDKAADRLWREMAADLSRQVVGVRDFAHLRHRYLEHPTINYRVLLVANRLTRQPYGIIVVRDEGDALELVDVVAPLRRIQTLVDIARRLAWNLDRSKVYAWITEHNAGIFTGPHGKATLSEIVIPMLTWPGNMPPDEIDNRWWLMAGDTDFR